MGGSMARQLRTPEINSLDSVRPEPAKANLTVNGGQSPLRSLTAEAIRRTGSQKEAAFEAGVDPAQLTRQLQTGHLTLERLERMGPSRLAELGRLMVETYAPLETPQARIREKAGELETIAREMRQLAEYIA